MVTRVTLSAILVLGLLGAGCIGDIGSKPSAAIQRPATPPGIVSTGPTPTRQPTGALGALTATPASQIPARIPQPPQAMPPSPPRPVVPLPGHPAIAVCGPIPAVPTIRSVVPAVCGGGFHPAEVVTLTLIGRLGRLTWLAVAGPDGSFRSAIPSGYCRLLALSIVARGSRGSLASAPATALTFCRML
jgi:hypothetical protein